MSIQRKMRRQIAKNQDTVRLNPLLDAALKEYKRRHGLVGLLGEAGMLVALKEIGAAAPESRGEWLVPPDWKAKCERYIRGAA